MDEGITEEHHSDDGIEENPSKLSRIWSHDCSFPQEFDAGMDVENAVTDLIVEPMNHPEAPSQSLEDMFFNGRPKEQQRIVLKYMQLSSKPAVTVDSAEPTTTKETCRVQKVDLKSPGHTITYWKFPSLKKQSSESDSDVDAYNCFRRIISKAALVEFIVQICGGSLSAGVEFFSRLLHCIDSEAHGRGRTNASGTMEPLMSATATYALQADSGISDNQRRIIARHLRHHNNSQPVSNIYK
jgi:hypothetical protein